MTIVSTTALIDATGTEHSFASSIPSAFQKIAGRPVLTWTISRFEAAETISSIAIICPEDGLLHVNNVVVNPYGFKKVSKIIPGGETRAESIIKALDALPLSTGFVAIHDAARPLISPDDINMTVLEARNQRAAVLGRPVHDPIRRVRDGFVMASLESDNLWLTEYPQVFQFDLIKEAYRNVQGSDTTFRDDAALIEALGFKIKMVAAKNVNPRLTAGDEADIIRLILEREDCAGI